MAGRSRMAATTFNRLEAASHEQRLMAVSSHARTTPACSNIHPGLEVPKHLLLRAKPRISGRRRHVPAPGHVALGIHALQVHAKAPQAGSVLQHLGGGLIQRPAVVLLVAQRECTVAAQVDVSDLDVGLACTQVVLT